MDFEELTHTYKHAADSLKLLSLRNRAYSDFFSILDEPFGKTRVDRLNSAILEMKSVNAKKKAKRGGTQ